MHLFLNIVRTKIGIYYVQGETTRLNEDGGKKGSGGGRTDRTTRMLVALLGLFLATELPQALFGLLTAIAPQLFEICYYAFGKYLLRHSIYIFISMNRSSPCAKDHVNLSV